MHLIRRAALRAASSAPSATSFLAKSRSINTSSPFALRLKAQSPIYSSVTRRFNSDEATKNEAHVEAADGEQGSVQSAINSASEAQTGNFESSSSSTGYNYQPRESKPYENRGDRPSYGNNARGEALPPITPNQSIYIGNLIFDATAEDLKREFSPFGNVQSAVIATDARGLSKGFGYIEFSSTTEATAAIEAKNQSILEGRRLMVNYMNKRPRRMENGPSKTLFIGNLAFEMTDADLNKLFRDLKNVVDVRVAIDRRTGQPRGFAHADFTDVESAVAGKAILDSKEVYGRVLRVDFSSGTKQDRRGPVPREEHEERDSQF
jgi:RNA recognition motif-containing protein